MLGPYPLWWKHSISGGLFSSYHTEFCFRQNESCFYYFECRVTPTACRVLTSRRVMWVLLSIIQWWLAFWWLCRPMPLQCTGGSVCWLWVVPGSSMETGEAHIGGSVQGCGMSFADPLDILPLIARFMGPTWGPSGADRTQLGPMLAPWILLSGAVWH